MATTMRNVGVQAAWLRFPDGTEVEIDPNEEANLVTFGTYEISNQVMPPQPIPFPAPTPSPVRTLVNHLSARPLELVGTYLPQAVLQPGITVNLPVGQVEFAYN